MNYLILAAIVAFWICVALECDNGPWTPGKVIGGVFWGLVMVAGMLLLGAGGDGARW